MSAEPAAGLREFHDVPVHSLQQHGLRQQHGAEVHSLSFSLHKLFRQRHDEGVQDLQGGVRVLQQVFFRVHVLSAEILRKFRRTELPEMRQDVSVLLRATTHHVFTMRLDRVLLQERDEGVHPLCTRPYVRRQCGENLQTVPRDLRDVYRADLEQLRQLQRHVLPLYQRYTLSMVSRRAVP